MRMTLKAARINKGLRQTDIAAALGISQPAYARMERDPGNIRVSRACQLADLLGVRFGDVFFQGDSIVDRVHEEEVDGDADRDRGDD